MSLRRLGNLTSKHGNSQYYKGTGARTGGRHTSKGRFIIDPLLQRFIVAPTKLQATAFKPYVAREIVDANKLPPIRKWKNGAFVGYPKVGRSSTAGDEMKKSGSSLPALSRG